jgi:HEAT repeat protein
MSDTPSPVRPKLPARQRGPAQLYLIGPAAKNSAAQPAATLVDRFRNLHEGPQVFHEVLRLGDEAVPALEGLLRGPSDAVHQPRCLAADALAAIGSATAVSALTRALLDSVARDPSPQLLQAESILVNHIAEHLSRFPRPEVTEALLSALRRRGYPYCAAALGLTGDPRAIALLVECLYEDAARPAAAAALRRFGQAALEPLVRVLEPPSAGTAESPSRLDGRVAAARLLGDFARANSQDAPFAVAALMEALKDSQCAVRIEAALGLVRCGARADGDTARILVAALEEENWARAEEIMRVLVSIGPAAERLLTPLIGLRPRDEADRRRRVRAVEALGRLGSVSAVSACSFFGRSASDHPAPSPPGAGWPSCTRSGFRDSPARGCRFACQWPRRRGAARGHCGGIALFEVGGLSLRRAGGGSRSAAAVVVACLRADRAGGQREPMPMSSASHFSRVRDGRASRKE